MSREFGRLPACFHPFNSMKFQENYDSSLKFLPEQAINTTGLKPK